MEIQDTQQALPNYLET